GAIRTAPTLCVPAWRWEDWAAADSGASRAPHFLQNLAAGWLATPQAAQTDSSFAPHSTQNEASVGLSWLQDGQRIGSPVASVTTTPRADGGRSTVLLEFAAEWPINCAPLAHPSHFLPAWQPDPGGVCHPVTSKTVTAPPATSPCFTRKSTTTPRSPGDGS